jgi:hypothetical protein
MRGKEVSAMKRGRRLIAAEAGLVLLTLLAVGCGGSSASPSL